MPCKYGTVIPNRLVVWYIRAEMVDPGSTLGEVAAVTHVAPEFTLKIVGKK